MEVHRHSFPRAHHLCTPARFAAVYDARVRDTRGPLLFYALPNTLGHLRMGLSVSRKVGTAPRRNRIKRLLREAYRANRHDFPAGYDLVIVVRPHEPFELEKYKRLLTDIVATLHKAWERKRSAIANVPVDAPVTDPPTQA